MFWSTSWAKLWLHHCSCHLDFLTILYGYLWSIFFLWSATCADLFIYLFERKKDTTLVPLFFFSFSVTELDLYWVAGNRNPGAEINSGGKVLLPEVWIEMLHCLDTNGVPLVRICSTIYREGMPNSQLPSNKTSQQITSNTYQRRKYS